MFSSVLLYSLFFSLFLSLWSSSFSSLSSRLRRTCTVDPIAQVVSPPLHQRWRQSDTHVTPHRMNQFMHTPQHVLPRPLAHPTRRVLLTSRRPPQLRRQRPPCRRPRPTCAGRGGTDEAQTKVRHGIYVNRLVIGVNRLFIYVNRLFRGKRRHRRRSVSKVVIIVIVQACQVFLSSLTHHSFIQS